MMKKIFICLCLLLALCACTQSSVESDKEDNTEVVQVEDTTEEDLQASEEETVEDTEKTSDDSSSQTNNNTDSSATETSKNNTESTTQSSNTNNNNSTTDQSTSSSNNQSTNDNKDSTATKSSSNTTTNNNTSDNESNSSSQNETTETTEETKIYCTYTIDCSSILNHTDVLESNYQVPSNGIIYSQTVEIKEGDTVMTILKRTGVSTDISLGYVKGIDGLYEFDCGSESGWTYSVNGTKPNVGASKYTVSDGDVIQWSYVVSRSEW